MSNHALNTNSHLVESFIETNNYFLDHRNQRLIIRKYPLNTDLKRLIPKWLDLAKASGLEKIWLWGYPKDLSILQKQGFISEGEFPSPQLQTPSLSFAYYLSPKRGYSAFIAEEDQLLQELQHKPLNSLSSLPPNFTVRTLNPNEAEHISKIMTEIFESYPTPVDNPLYIQKLMQSGCRFAGAFVHDKLVSIASAYPEEDYGRCEMTDCTTLPDFRGYGLTERILGFLESSIKESYTPYSLARARSFAMNRVFYKLGYTYKGRLINNCDIGGGFEDMNLWVKANNETPLRFDQESR